MTHSHNLHCTSKTTGSTQAQNQAFDVVHSPARPVRTPFSILVFFVLVVSVVLHEAKIYMAYKFVLLSRFNSQDIFIFIYLTSVVVFEFQICNIKPGSVRPIAKRLKFGQGDDTDFGRYKEDEKGSIESSRERGAYCMCYVFGVRLKFFSGFLALLEALFVQLWVFDLQ